MEEVSHLIKKAKAHKIPFPKNYASEFLIFEKGEGVYLFDLDGKKYIDFGSGIAVNSLGHGREDLALTAYEQMKKVVHTSNLYTTEPSLVLAEKLRALGNFDAVHFGNSGTEANEAAIKYARLYSYNKKGLGNHKILAMEAGFHGRTMGALACTHNTAYKTSFEPLLTDVEFVPLNDVETLTKKLDSAFAAVIVEVIQGEGGLKMMTGEYAKALNTLCKEHDVILIADEVQTGIGRTGWPFACSLVDLEPDIMTLAKPLAAGLPLSATLIPGKINDYLKPGDHGSTFGGGPVTCAVAGQVLDIVFDPSFLADVRKAGEYLAKKLEESAKKFSFTGKILGTGLLLGLEIIQPLGYANDLLKEIITKSEENGLLILRSGKNIVRIAPPLIIEEKQIDEGIEIFTKVLESFEI
ncbi:MAG: acetylornithine/succinylornithine family transaminase [Spirochaetes bacterium]|nr:acetylornithine/succinylornithine family transaminase [Spirochaetota bacterium]